METAQMDPEIQSAIMTNITRCLNSQPPIPITEISLTVQAAIDIQNDIGWENFFEGWVAKEWEHTQIAYYEWC
jgi:hypothetical protein